MVLVSSKQHPRRTNDFATVAVRLFLPCFLLFAFFDAKFLQFLRQQKSSIRGYYTNKTTTEGTLSTGNLNRGETIDTGKHVAVGADESRASQSSNTGKNTTRTTTTTCLDPKGPQPYVLLARGRSGSGSTLQVLGTLTGKHIPGDHEFTGSTPNQARNFFFQKIGPNDGGKWVVEYLCEQQRQHPNAGVVGFKWKPYSEAMFSPAALNGLDLISRAVNPTIKVVRLRRNLLDNFISDRKHEMTKISSHCKARDIDCVEKHKQAGVNLTLSVPDLLAFLESETNQ